MTKSHERQGAGSKSVAPQSGHQGRAEGCTEGWIQAMLMTTVRQRSLLVVAIHPSASARLTRVGKRFRWVYGGMDPGDVDDDCSSEESVSSSDPPISIGPSHEGGEAISMGVRRDGSRRC